MLTQGLLLFELLCLFKLSKQGVPLLNRLVYFASSRAGAQTVLADNIEGHLVVVDMVMRTSAKRTVLNGNCHDSLLVSCLGLVLPVTSV
jgi:hypothetical protein